MSEMSHEDAIQALSEAASADAAAEQAVEVTPPAPEEAPAPEQGAPVNEQPPVEGQVEETPPADELTPFNPDDLPEELMAGWKQLQAAYTPRLQEAAAIRKQLEELGGQESIQQAVELSRWMQDPNNWPEVYETVYQMMNEAGFEFEDDQSPLAPAPEGGFEGLADDPDLAPIAQSLRALQEQQAGQQQLIEQFYAQQEAQRQAAQMEMQQMQYLAEMQRQVSGVRQANPQYTDDDMRVVIELASFYNDDIPAAAQRYESIRADVLTRYIEGKKSADTPVVHTPAGAGVVSHEVKEAESLEEVEDEVAELMRTLQAQGVFDGEFA